MNLILDYIATSKYIIIILGIVLVSFLIFSTLYFFIKEKPKKEKETKESLDNENSNK